MDNLATTHVVERTSPKGTSFVGECLLCGMQGLSMADAFALCKNTSRVTANDALMMAIVGRRQNA